VVSAESRGQELVLGGKAYTLRTEGPPEDTAICDGRPVKRYVLSEGARRQVLIDGDLCSKFDLRWAGDLDGDGLLDLVLYEDLEGGGFLRLFLSSDAPKGTLVREAAKSEHRGC